MDIPEHSSVFLVPSLYPVLPLLLGELVLLQDSAYTHINTMTSPEGMSNKRAIVSSGGNRPKDAFQDSSDLEIFVKIKFKHFSNKLLFLASLFVYRP